MSPPDNTEKHPALPENKRKSKFPSILTAKREGKQAILAAEQLFGS